MMLARVSSSPQVARAKRLRWNRQLNAQPPRAPPPFTRGKPKSYLPHDITLQNSKFKNFKSKFTNNIIHYNKTNLAKVKKFRMFVK